MGERDGERAGLRGRRRAAGALVAVVTACAAVAVLLLGLTRGPSAVAAVTALSGAVAVLSGLAVVVACPPWSQAERFRTLIGGAEPAPAAPPRRHGVRGPLTGLGNRRALTEAMSAPAPSGRCLATVDLDGFKEVNALLGRGARADSRRAVSPAAP